MATNHFYPDWSKIFEMVKVPGMFREKMIDAAALKVRSFDTSHTKRTGRSKRRQNVFRLRGTQGSTSIIGAKTETTIQQYVSQPNAPQPPPVEEWESSSGSELSQDEGSVDRH